MQTKWGSLLLAMTVGVMADGCVRECNYQGQCGADQYCTPDGLCEVLPGGGQLNNTGDGDGDIVLTGDGDGDGDVGGGAVGGGGGGSAQCGGGLQTFNSNEVVIMGTIAEGACGAEAVAQLGDPWDFGYGLHCHIGRAFVRPSNGSVVYTRAFYDSFYVYDADPREWDNEGERCVYDGPGIDNDDELVPSACPTGMNSNSWLLNPDTSLPIYQCSGSEDWYDLAGDVFFSPVDGEDLISIGTSGRLLVSDRFGDAFSIIDLETDTTTEVVLPHDEGSWDLVVARNKPNGFYALFNEGFDGVNKTYDIAYTGEVTELATLDTGEWRYVGYHATFDRFGSVYAMRSGSDDEIHKFDTTGAHSVPYTEADQPGPDDDRPYVLLHGSFIFSGT